MSGVIKAGARPSPTAAELREVFDLKHGPAEGHGPNVRLWKRLGYFNPDDVYEATVAGLVGPGTAWADVGGGRSPFPNNEPLARLLAARCGLFVGIDPDAAIEENPFVHERARATIDAYRGGRTFDLVTLRMVAEHVAEPGAAVAALARLTRPGGMVVVYTVDLWSPAAWAARLVPFRLHHAIKRSLWGTEERDTFPVVYRMNSRRRLAQLFETEGFREAGFSRLDDCRIFYRCRPLHHLELRLRGLFRRLGVRHPETCLLGLYERLADDRTPAERP